jgi:hypothetical protein
MKKLKNEKLKKIRILTKKILEFSNSIRNVEKSQFIKLCTKILNQKLKNIGVLKFNQSIETKFISEKDFYKRKITNIIKAKIKNIQYGEILKLMKKKKILLKNIIIHTSDIFLSLISEQSLDIKI